MKAILLLFITFGSVQAFAYPTVGDQAVYDTTVISSQGTGTLTMTSTITSINAANDQVAVKQTSTTAAGTSQSPDVTRSLKELQSYDTMSTCANVPAELSPVAEVIAVPAGTFQACHIKVNQNSMQSEVWIGMVTFGMVKIMIKTNQNQTITQALRSFIRQ